MRPALIAAFGLALISCSGDNGDPIREAIGDFRQECTDTMTGNWRAWCWRIADSYAECLDQDEPRPCMERISDALGDAAAQLNAIDL